MAFKMNGWSAFTKKANKPSDGRAASSAFQSNGDDDKNVLIEEANKAVGQLTPPKTGVRNLIEIARAKEVKPNLLNERQRKRLKTLIEKRRKVDKNTPAWVTIQNKINKLKEKEQGLEKGTYKRRKRKDYK
tara:strand:+ start:545 stop:937 length:393 start_codon:yes stop_codon:yes gene_type:complete